MIRLISAADSLTNKATVVTNAGALLISCAACSGLTARGLGAYKTKPRASAPLETAACTSSLRVNPHILTRTLLTKAHLNLINNGNESLTEFRYLHICITRSDYKAKALQRLDPKVETVY